MLYELITTQAHTGLPLPGAGKGYFKFDVM